MKKKTYQFEKFLKNTFDQFSIKQNEVLVEDDLNDIIMNVCGKALVLMINEKREMNLLMGNTPEERYQYFENEYSSTGKAFEEIKDKFPVIYIDLKNSINSYLKLVSQIMKDFKKDYSLLVERKIIEEHTTISTMKIKGDLHNGKAVIEITTNKSKLIYKPKSLSNDVFFNNFLKYMDSFFIKEGKSTKYKENFYLVNTLDMKTYGWVEYVDKKPINSFEEARNYYRKIGVLLSVAYTLNLTDLHFENVISQGENPCIIDLETMFNMPMFVKDYKNESRNIINGKIMDSVVSTGMLPVLGIDSLFGGDPSGILGGTFSKEERVIINPFRDDIKFQKIVVRSVFKDHIPFFNNNNEKRYCKPKDYVNDIIKGFEKTYKIIVKNKEKILGFLKKESSSVTCRILFRNTMEYSVLLNAAKSPVYSNKREEIFEKLSTFNRGLGNDIIKSEISQINTLSIPYFNCQVDSNLIKNMDGETIFEHTLTPFKCFLSKYRRLCVDDMEQQVKLIRFSIQSQEQLFKDGEQFSLYKKQKGSQEDLLIAINELSSILENNAYIGTSDDTINWMSLGIADNDQILFESLENDIYKGISGIGLALLEYYEFYPNINTKKILKLIYKNISKDFINTNNEPQNYGFYVGLIGEYSFLRKYEKVFHKTSSCNILKNILKDFTPEKCQTILPSDDVIAGEAGIIIYISNLNNYLEYRDEIDILLKSLSNKIKLKESIASYAHGNSGIATAFVHGYKVTKNEKYLKIFHELWNLENSSKLRRGWTDSRKVDSSYSSQWCHGASGQAIARMEWITVNKTARFLSNSELIKVKKELGELIDILKKEGMYTDNFCLCHGILGNLLILNTYQENFDNKNINLKNEILNNYYSVCNYGLNKGWICGLGTEFYSYGLMTGISGILYGLIRQVKQKNNFGVLMPYVD